jgi:hypothetical protein
MKTSARPKKSTLFFGKVNIILRIGIQVDKFIKKAGIICHGV